MTLSSRTKYYITETICLLYILLFIYASASKLMDFQHFRIQLGQSPLLSAFTEQVAVIVPVTEILICVLLLIPKYKPAGLFAAYGLMVMFTAYIFIILNYTSFVPCSCGGVLEKLGWQSHLIFNLFFVFLAVFGIILHGGGTHKFHFINKKKLTALFSALTISSISIVVVMFLFSENIIHYHNRLTRRFPHTPITRTGVNDLKLNSYYFAGADNLHVYLGNSTAPLSITVLSSRLVQLEKSMIDLDNKELPFRGVKISVRPPYFFVTDGTVPCIFRGKVRDWKAELARQKGEYFTTAAAIDSVRIAVLSNSSKTGDNVLGIIETAEQGRTILNPDILQKQTDGVFDTDGHLLYSEGMEKIIYLYAYRNQFTIADRSLKIISRGTTIDTIATAKLSIARDVKHGQRELSKPPLFVNKNSAVYKNLLFVNSAIPGLYENSRMWKEASIIDVYDLAAKSYLLSFCIYHYEGMKMKKFAVQNDQLYVLAGNYIISYKIDSKITSKYIKNDTDNLLAK
ncbi:DoxX family protein [Flavobacterium sp. LC2016-01]|uniref:MauE/DoxX family redox-associated membrane protein n=1 Tax=Flavobacterium sp. LC2016-01 TaxID=2675876 RepID=UPI0012BA62E4|nr:DoxX family protein [Flavobacterium sp. LC2016-01]MTH15897.1 hypothetical protein [Flavobacterium sp. LC2016-01]